MKLGHLFAASGIAVPDGAADIDVRSLVYYSRKAAPGAVFVAIPGFHRDGHEFVADAAKRGAAAIVAEKKVRTKAPLAVVPDARVLAMPPRVASAPGSTKKLRPVFSRALSS